MKLIHLAAAGLLLSSTAATTMATDMPEREHRAIWVSAYLTGGWPSSAITQSTAETTKLRCRQAMQTYKDRNINVLYYHVRSNCDAMYNSAYEPWSAKAAGTRGVAPLFDPFEYYIQTAHEYGIEVYAWINPYRYNNNVSYSGANEYENTHPDWLIKNSNQTTLNPGLEEVKQRICDVVADILNKYDVDGVVFDDYFYPQGGTSTNTDAPDYALWQQKGNGMSIADWRRANVNEMVQRVHDTIKGIKPYVAFCIAPAGIAAPAGITSSQYGLPEISGDWQYNQIYSDPLNWLKNGIIDIISPQIYWPTRFNEVDAWWANAAKKYNRHYYPSVDITDVGANKQTAEFIREMEQTRSTARANEAGIVFFQNNDYINQNENVYGSVKRFSENFAIGAVPTKAMTPLRTWEKVETPALVSNVAKNGNTLSWSNITGMRYVIYAHAKAMNTPFAIDINDMHGVSYANSYTLPDNADDYDWYVATYDRYGNVSSPMAVGATPGTAASPVLGYPGNASEPDILFNFAWTSANSGRNVVEVARDAAFTDLVGAVSAGAANVLSMTAFPEFEAGKTYYWRVKLTPVNAPTAVSEVHSFTAPQLLVSAPANEAADVPVTPTITWTKGGTGTEFYFELSTTSTFDNAVYSAQTTANTVTIPTKLLVTGRKYYARVKAELNGKSLTSQITSFTTVNVTDYTAPAFVGGIAEGTLHANQPIQVADWTGMNTVTVQVSKASNFPPRGGLATYTLANFATATAVTGAEIKLSTAYLEDGTTYYARSKGTYYNNNTPKDTDYSSTVTFVYSAQAGVDNVVADVNEIYCTLDGTLHAAVGANVTVHTTAGALVKSLTTTAADTALNLVPGAYIITVNASGNTTSLKVVI